MRGSDGANQYGKRHKEPYRHRKTLEAFLRFVRLSRTEATAHTYMSKLRPLLRAWEPLSPQEWTNLAFEDYVGLAKEGKVPGQPTPLSVRSVQMLLQAVKLFGEWCLTHAVPCPNFWGGITRPRSVRRELTGLLTLDQVKRMIECAYGTRLELAISLAVGTGMRKGEVQRAIWEDYREADNTILARREKTHLHHRMPVPPFVREILKRRQQGQTGLIVGKGRVQLRFRQSGVAGRPQPGGDTMPHAPSRALSWRASIQPTT